MYDLSPRGVFVHERVYRNPRAVVRLERMLAALGLDRAEVPTVGANDVERIAEVAGATEELATESTLRSGHGRIRQGHLKVTDDPVIVFNTFVWNEADREPVCGDYRNVHTARLAQTFAGVGEEFAWSQRELFIHDAFVCQGGWGIHTLGGCVHKCDYCGQGFIVNIMLDLEDFCDHLAAMFQRRPEQKLYRYDLFSDICAFEPEYGASELFGKCFAEHDRYLLLYTRSDNIRYLAELEERRHVLINWTLSMDTQARVIERDSPSLADRIEAMRFCQQHGYVVRAGFSPIIPVRNWRQETTAMLELLFDRVAPDVLRGWVLAMMDAAEFEMMFDAGMMDPVFMRRMREAAPELNGKRIAPFPLDVRAEIYRYYLEETRRLDPTTPFALCSEHPELWNMLATRLQMTPDAMYCCCGAVSVPRRRAACGGR